MFKTIKKTFNFSTDEVFDIVVKHLQEMGQIGSNKSKEGIYYQFSGELEFDEEEDGTFFSVSVTEEE